MTNHQKPAPMTDEQIMAEFAKLYPRDVGILELAKNNRDFMVESIGARHHWAAFKAGAEMVSAARDAQWEQLQMRTQPNYWIEGRSPLDGMVYDITGAEPPPPNSGFARLGEFE